MHALVTGAGGFLGRYLVEQLLARGDRVRGFGRGEYPQLEAMGAQMVRGDIRNRDDVARACHHVDTVFHVAALPGIAINRRAYDEVNRIGTENVIEACRHQGVERLVYTSSPSVVFAGRDQVGIDESAPYDFAWMEAHRAWYSLSKAHGEQAVLGANCENLKTCALRPHLIWGPRDGHLIPRLIARARAGRLRRIGDGANLIDMIYVENAAHAHLLAADALTNGASGSNASPVAGQAYFLSQGEPVNCWQWINEILALVELPPVEKSMSLKSAWRLGAVCEGIYRWLGLTPEPPMTRFLAAQLATSHWYDISAARRELGYEARISTAEGMRRLAKWLRQNSTPRQADQAPQAAQP